MNLLSIGGSDPSSGAGIQSDVRLFSSLGAHCLTVVTAITSQNTSGYGKSEPVSKKALKGQLESVLSDFKIHGIKIGMVYNSDVIKVLYGRLKKSGVPIVVDPVIRSTTGGKLIKNSAVKDFQKLLIPLATVITPNRFEAEVLSGTKINARNPPEKIARMIQRCGADNVVITGIDLKDGRVSDFVLEKDKRYLVTGEKIPKTNHGSGCNYSAALLYALARKKGVRESVKFAKMTACDSIKNAKKVGRGIEITDVHDDRIKSELSDAIIKFAEIRNIYRNIPECQTNFVFSRQGPRSTRDILGVSGRIVRAGRQVVMAGELEYGGSKHVATALLAMNRKFPEMCSAINLRYQDSVLLKVKRSGLQASSYDRGKEPRTVKAKQSTIEWGIRDAVKDSAEAPDVVYHKGDFGKEPMIIVFGETPNAVLGKVSRII